MPRSKASGSAPAGAARVSFVLGKGGVGRTTVASALAADFARAGESVLLVSPKARSEATERVRDAVAASGGRLDLLETSERQLVDDAVRRITRLGPMAEVVFRHPAYESFTDIVPGIRELALLNLVYETRENPEKPYQRIVIDGPATGHGLHFLEAPDKATRLLVGKLADRARALAAMLRDPAAVEVVLVTLPQEIPVREALELAAKLREQGFPVDNLVVNRWMPPLFTDRGSDDLLRRIAADGEARERLARAVAPRSRIDVDQALEAIQLVRDERREAEARLAELRSFDAKISLVPMLPEEDRLARVAAALRKVLRAGEAAA